MSLRWNWRLENYSPEGSHEAVRVDIGVGSNWRECQEKRLVGLNGFVQKPVRLLGKDMGGILSSVAHRWRFISLENTVHIIIGMRVK